MGEPLLSYSGGTAPASHRLPCYALTGTRGVVIQLSSPHAVYTPATWRSTWKGRTVGVERERATLPAHGCPWSAGSITAREADVFVCRGCCCGTERKHPGIDHGAQLESSPCGWRPPRRAPRSRSRTAWGTANGPTSWSLTSRSGAGSMGAVPAGSVGYWRLTRQQPFAPGSAPAAQRLRPPELRESLFEPDDDARASLRTTRR